MCPAQIAIIQISPKEVGLFQVSPSQGSSFHVSSLENSPLQVRVTEIRPLQVHPRHMPLLQRRRIPLLTSESPTRTRQRQFAQVHLAQIRTPQIQPPQLSLLHIIPINRPPSLLMRNQQPLNISPPKLNILERIDPSLNISLYSQPLPEELLPLKVNFRFGAPTVMRFVCLLLHQV